jgi:hypothetical protein
MMIERHDEDLSPEVIEKQYLQNKLFPHKFNPYLEKKDVKRSYLTHLKTLLHNQ